MFVVSAAAASDPHDAFLQPRRGQLHVPSGDTRSRRCRATSLPDHGEAVVTRATGASRQGPAEKHGPQATGLWSSRCGPLLLTFVHWKNVIYLKKSITCRSKIFTNTSSMIATEG